MQTLGLPIESDARPVLLPEHLARAFTGVSQECLDEIARIEAFIRDSHARARYIVLD